MADKYMAEDCRYREAVCIDANRIYDSCSDKDCIEDLPVYFTDCTQGIIDRAMNVRAKKAEVVNVFVDLEPIPFNRGFFSVDMTFYFDVELEVSTAHGMPCNVVHGLAVFSKKVILYGSEGGVKIFSSDFCLDRNDSQEPMTKNLPKATVQVATPIVLSAKLKEKEKCCCCCCNIPRCVSCCFDGDFTHEHGDNTVVVTIGLFSIVQIERNVSMLIHAYDFCIPEKRCVESSDSPCKLFDRIKFPVDEFFPPKAGDIKCNDNDKCEPRKQCGCK